MKIDIVKVVVLKEIVVEVVILKEIATLSRLPACAVFQRLGSATYAAVPPRRDDERGPSVPREYVLPDVLRLSKILAHQNEVEVLRPVRRGRAVRRRDGPAGAQYLPPAKHVSEPGSTAAHGASSYSSSFE